MAPETPYWIATLVVLMLMMIVVPYRRWRARIPGERVSRKDEGPFVFVALPVVGFGFWIGMLAYLINPAWMQWASLLLPAWVRWSGAAIAVFAVGLIYWTLAHLGKNLTSTVVVKSNATLVQTGPYRLVRHPFYVSGAVWLLGVFLLTANWFLGLSGLFLILLLILRTPREEQRLIDRFGDQYRMYMQTTGRFFPRVQTKLR
jgi:protein-S-isoprenylcysteine O-methyltransferase Ste14